MPSLLQNVSDAVETLNFSTEITGRVKGLFGVVAPVNLSFVLTAAVGAVFVFLGVNTSSCSCFSWGGTMGEGSKVAVALLIGLTSGCLSPVAWAIYVKPDSILATSCGAWAFRNMRWLSALWLFLALVVAQCEISEGGSGGLLIVLLIAVTGGTAGAFLVARGFFLNRVRGFYKRGTEMLLTELCDRLTNVLKDKYDIGPPDDTHDSKLRADIMLPTRGGFMVQIFAQTQMIADPDVAIALPVAEQFPTSTAYRLNVWCVGDKAAIEQERNHQTDAYQRKMQGVQAVWAIPLSREGLLPISNDNPTGLYRAIIEKVPRNPVGTLSVTGWYWAFLDDLQEKREDSLLDVLETLVKDNQDIHDLCLLIALAVAQLHNIQLRFGERF